MSASQARAIDAIAFELAAAVENYEQACEQLVATRPDMALYQSVSRQVDHMRLLCASLPQVSVAWVGLLISHAELVHCLWRCGEKSALSPELEACQVRHAHAIRALREKCVWLFSRAES